MTPPPRSPRFEKYQCDLKQAAELLQNARKKAFEKDGYLSEATRNGMREELKRRNVSWCPASLSLSVYF
jgi:hypothetical protein